MSERVYGGNTEDCENATHNKEDCMEAFYGLEKLPYSQWCTPCKRQKDDRYNPKHPITSICC
jgi:hypothetical protein